MELEDLKKGNQLLDEMRLLRESIFSINEYLPQIPQMNEEPNRYTVCSKRKETESNYITIRKNRNIFSKLVLYDIKDKDLSALKESLEKRLEECKKAFDEL